MKQPPKKYQLDQIQVSSFVPEQTETQNLKGGGTPATAAASAALTVSLAYLAKVTEKLGPNPGSAVCATAAARTCS